MRKRQYPAILTIIFLMVVCIKQSLAEIIASGDDCAADGSFCHWEIDSNGKLLISGNGHMKNYKCCGYQPYIEYADKITDIEIGEGIISTGARAFQSLGHAKNISIPSSLETISTLAFDYSYALERINFSDNSKLKNIESAAFQNSGIKEFMVPSSVNFIDSSAFGNSGLVSLIIPDSVTKINDYLFRGTLGDARDLKEIIIYDSINVDNWDSGTFVGIPSDVKFRCLGNVTACNIALNKYGVTTSPATESQCNGSGSYYYTGSSCEHRPEDPDDMVCTGGYAKLKNNCVDPLKTFAKKRYTPAEANQWLKDEDNEITITFKK